MSINHLKEVGGMRKIVFVAIFLIGTMFSVFSQAETLEIVKDGESLAPIVVFEDAPRFTRLAADELAHYIEKVSGARPEVVEGRPDPLPDKAIWVGYQPVMDELFPDLDFAFEHPEEILIAANGEHLVIAGRDRWKPDHMVMRTSRGELEGVQMEYGTANAVYTFIQDYLNVRWFWPGELGEDILEQKTIGFEPLEYRYHPQFRSRRSLFLHVAMQRLTYRGNYYQGGDWGNQEWVKFQRHLLDSLAHPGGHDFTDWWARFHEDHPEYFALQPDGTRSAFPNPKNVKLCHSNPDVWRQWLADVEKTIERNPIRTVFGASPGDSYRSGHCICADCLAWDHPDAERYTFTWEGIGQPYVSLTDRHIKFANKLAGMLRERYPEEDYYVGMTAYGNWRSPPMGVEAAENIVIRAVFNFHNRRPELSDPHRELFRGWAEAAPTLIWKPNLGPAEPRAAYPKVSTRSAIDNMRFAAEHNAVGIVFDKLWYNWATNGLNYYILARMAWNPYADGEALLDDYYQRGFGKAADDIEAYWTLMEQGNDRIVKGGESWWKVYDEKFCAEARDHLESAFDALEGEPEKYRKRVEFLEVGLDYTQGLAQTIPLMQRAEADETAEEEALRIWLDRLKPLVNHSEYTHAFRRIKFPSPRPGRLDELW